MSRTKATKVEKKGGSREKAGIVSFHLRCAKTANGLTHFVMYGDVPRKKMPL